MPEIHAYCFKCRKKVLVKDPQQITMANGRPAITGSCPTDGAKVFKIGRVVVEAVA
jgi:hypothetical protein